MMKEYTNYELIEKTGSFLETTPDFNLFKDGNDYVLIWEKKEEIRTADENEFLKKIEEIIILNRDLKELYDEWRKVSNQFEAEEGNKAWDCGEPSCRKNFSEFVGREVEFEEMQELENNWNFWNEEE